MPLTFVPFQKQVVSTGGTGSLVLGAASSGFQALGASQDGKTIEYSISDGTAWETTVGVYTHSTTTITRAGTFNSSTGSRLNVNVGAFVYCDVNELLLNGHDVALQTFIAGCLVTKHAAANTLDISAGSFYDPIACRVIEYAGASAVSAGSLGASQWNQVYIYDNAGTATLEVVNNADPPSSTYAGTARKGGTGGNRRWIGSFLTTAASAIYDMQVSEYASALEVIWFSDTTVSPFRVVSGSSSLAVLVAVTLTPVPKYAARKALFEMVTTLASSAPGDAGSTFSADGTNTHGGAAGYVAVANANYPTTTAWLPIDAGTPRIWYRTDNTGAIIYMQVLGFMVTR